MKSSTDDSRLTVHTQADWEEWLERHGQASSGVWLRLAKKGAKHPTVTYQEGRTLGQGLRTRKYINHS
jgi:hypothetical protein